MDSSYDAVTRTEDAVRFAESQFGRHHLKRLEKRRKQYQELAEDTQYTDSYRAHMATKASVYKSELDYFATAQKVKDDPTMMKRLIDKLSRKGADPDEV